MTTDKADETSGIHGDEFRKLFYSNPQPMWVYDLETLSFLEVNDAALAKYGYTAEEFRRMTIKDIRPAEDVPKLLQNVAEITNGYSSSGLWRHLKKDGSLLTVEISSHTMTFNGRKAELVMALDVTDRLVAEQRLRENELRLRQIADNIKHVFWMSNPEKTEIYFISPAYEQIWGRTTDELYRSPMSWMDAIHEEDRERVRTAAVSTQREGTYNEVYRIVRPDGTIRWIRDRAFPVYNERGEIYRISGFAADITEYVESERALQESETRFRTLADTASAAIFIYGTKFTYVNPAGEILTGYTSKELLMMNFWDIVHPEHRAMIRQRGEARLKGESVPNRYEFKILRKDGEIRWIEFSAGLFKPSGTAYAIGTAFDITMRKQAEEKVAENERQLLTLMNNLPGMVYRCANDAQWTTLFLSNGCEALTGYQVNDLLMNKNIKFGDIIHPEDRTMVWETIQRYLDKRTSYQIEYRIVTTDGTIKWVWEQGQGVFDENGALLFLEGFIMDINDRKKSEEDLFLKSQELDRYFTASLDLLCIADTDGYFRRLNPEWETTLGYKLHVLEGKQFFDFVHPDDIASTQKAVSKLHSQREVTNFVNRYRHKNGSYRWLEWRSYPQGELIYATARDITDRIHTEAALRESETKYHELVDSSTDGIVILQDGKVKFANPMVAKLRGEPIENIVGTDFLKFVHPDERPRMADHYLKRNRGDQILRTYTTLFLRSDGTRVHVELSASLISYQGKPANQVMIHDITEGKIAEEKLQMSEERFRTIFDNSTVGKSITLADGTMQVNKSFASMLGFTQEELQSKNWKEITHPDDVKLSEEIFESILSGREKSAHFEKRYVNKNGTIVWTDVSTVIERDTDGKPKFFITAISDITRRKEAEDQLAKMRMGIERSHDAIFITDIHGTIQYVNPAFEQIYGYSLSEATGKTPRILKSGNLTQKYYEQFWNTLLSKKPVIMEIVNKTKEGRLISVEVSNNPILDEKENIVGFMGIHRDITGRKQLEQQFFQSQKMDSIGTLAGGIAHDFNNILAIVLGNVDLMSRVRDNFDKQTEGLDAIAKATRRGAALVKQILTFARKTESSIQPVRINDVVEEIRLLVKETFPKTIDIQIALDSTITTVNADHTQLHQAVLNLVVNARDAMPSGGLLSIRTARMSYTELEGKFINGIADEYARISVRDTGTGMDAKTKEHIFEPFFTTKEKGKGTGLGLATVYGVVKSHKGHIEVESTPGEGTAFHLYFPITDAQINDNQQISIADTVQSRGNETILMVEDEEVLSDLVSKAFTSNGYSILTAGNGEEGFNLYQQHKDTIALVFSDMDLPKQTGYEMFKKIKHLNPKVKFIVASGYLEPELKDRIINEGVYRCLQKPYAIDEVLRIVREALQ